MELDNGNHKVRLVLCVKKRYVKGASRLKARHFLFHAGTGTKWRIDVWSKTSLPPALSVGWLSLHWEHSKNKPSFTLPALPQQHHQNYNNNKIIIIIC